MTRRLTVGATPRERPQTMRLGVHSAGAAGPAAGADGIAACMADPPDEHTGGVR